ncbi:EAL domain-containing protein [Aliikangiella maris]|uniref:EAL domain-containing protein n=2 Tax=Aliikangiella maris TaxID=3162458 RepID=A0ABV3MLN3_9GAMM
MINQPAAKSVILIVDDLPSNIRILNEAVKDLGNIYFATEGQSAIQKAQEYHPDIILLDIEMPGMNGYEVVARIKSIPELADTAVIFVTSHQQNTHEVKALESGGVDFIQKPINLSVTRARVKTQLTLQTQKKAILQSANDLSLLVNTLPAFIAYWDKSETNIFCNDQHGAWFGLKSSEMQGKDLQHIVPNSVYHSLRPLINLVLRGKHSTIDIPCSGHEANTIYGQVTMVPRIASSPEEGFLMLITDITRRKIAEQSLVDEKERIRITLNSIGDAVIATDTEGLITFLNPIAEDMTGWTSDNAQGQPIEIVMPLFDSENGHELRNPIRVALEEKRIIGMDVNCVLGRSKNNQIALEDSAAPIINHLNEVTGAIIVFHDVSEARAMALKMTHLAQHDVITNLPNRLLLRDRALQALQKGKRTGHKVALLMFDIDDFKNINDLVDHDGGDLLLRKIAEVITQELRQEDTLCRRGGDEFIILLSDIENNIEITQFTSRLFKVFTRKWEIKNHQFQLTISLGAAVSPDDSLDLDELYRHADAAMFTAKRNGRNRYQFYSKEIEARLLIKKHLENAVANQGENHGFEVHYQPKIDVIHNRIIGVEALVRWRNQDNKIINPIQFIPLAEETGLIIPLGELILKQACEQAYQWETSGHGIGVAVNISLVQFEHKDFFNTVTQIIEQSKISPHLIELEITESVLAKDTEKARKLILKLQEFGVKVALDDFGTGYSSLAYIKDFTFDVLKIDQSFVKNTLENKKDQAIIFAIIQMAKGLDLKLVAEGVETKEHSDFLLNLGCNVMQGYYYSKPVIAKEIDKLLQEFSAVAPAKN